MASTTFPGANQVTTLKFDKAGNKRPGRKYQANAPKKTNRKNLHRVMLQPFTVMFCDLCIVVNMAVDIKVDGQIMLAGLTRYLRVRPAKL